MPTASGFEFGSAQAEALRLLDEAERRRDAFGVDEGYFPIRTAEFLLLLGKLGRVEDLQTRDVLEVGCGRGWSLRLWCTVARRVVGVDLPPAVAAARELLAAFPPGPGRVDLVPGRAEDLTGADGPFDLVVTQYTLEHVDDIPRTLRGLGTRVGPGGHVVHILNSLVDRHDWHIEYRRQCSPWRRLWASLREQGVTRTLATLGAFTPAHERRFGDFATETREYRLERWALRLMRAGFEVVDFFQTRDVNWVLVTRPLSAHGADHRWREGER
jgi:SAM-dependent methyltransferase